MIRTKVSSVLIAIVIFNGGCSDFRLKEALKDQDIIGFLGVALSFLFSVYNGYPNEVINFVHESVLELLALYLLRPFLLSFWNK